MFGIGKNVEMTHYTQDEIQNEVDISGYFNFSFIRNPWERLASEFSWRRRNEETRYPILSDINDFNEFVCNLEQVFPKIMNKEYSQRNCSHFIPQNKFMTSVDFIGRYENFEKDLSYLGTKYGIEKTIPHVNKSKNKPWQEYYNDESVKIVSELYADDIKMFGYSIN